jgi:carotenoid cleavage dioxygenase
VADPRDTDTDELDLEAVRRAGAEAAEAAAERAAGAAVGDAGHGPDGREPVEPEIPDRRPGTNPYLVGNFAPVTVEHTVDVPLPVDGAIPPGLEGILFRNGPNPAIVAEPERYHWFSGDGMVHAVELRDGQAISYRNRWVRTRRLAAEIGTRPPAGPEEPIDGPANTHVVWHHGQLLALVESGFPHALTTELATVRVEDFDGMLTSPMTAHPHVDPATGGMAFFGYDVFGPPYLRYHEMDAGGALVFSTAIETPRATMHHDFGVTATRVVFLDLPVVFDLALAAGGAAIPFRWDDEAPARIGVLDRGSPGTRITWTGIDPAYVFHVMNAFDDGTAVVLDVCTYDKVLDTGEGGLLGSTLPSLERWRVDPVAGRVEVTVLDDRTVEFPRIDDTLAGRPYRYGYCTELRRDGGTDSFDALVRYDLQRDEAIHWSPGPGRSPGEPVFVRAPDGRSDDEGWVLSVVYDAGRDASDIVILDASSFKGTPEAVIHLPVRVPYGFHGSWVPADRYR